MKNPVFWTISFWYISLFPGRLPFDSSDAIRMIQRGESTEQWTPLFFWFLKVFTFNGQSIFIASGFTALGFIYSFKYLIKSICFASKMNEAKILFWISLTPIYGFWSVTVSHDSTFVIGFVMTVAILLRTASNQEISVRKQDIFIAAIFLLTSWVGYVLCFIFLISLLMSRFQGIIRISTAILLIALTSSVGISPTRADVAFRPFLVDMKCVVQHQEAVISQQTWATLIEIAPKDLWLEPVRCSSMDGAVESLNSNSSDLSMLRWKKIIPAYLQLLKDNPAIILVGHIQRSSVALPPILFQPPKNQVSWDLSVPVGMSTNIMIQQGPEVIHPSVDEESVDVDFPIFGYLEIPAQLLAFLVNQASWFWGWGGLWIIPAIFLIHTRFSCFGRKRMSFVYIQILIFHLMLVALMPDPTPRYVLPSLLFGNLSVIILFVSRNSEEKSPNL